MNKPLLSICIPTYNRSQYLKELLDSIVIQFSNPKIKEMVEVVISDNASVDDTTAVVKEYQKRFNNVHYFRNDENVGFDLNILNVVKKANGVYCWYMGDDDTIVNGGLSYICDRLKNFQYDILTVESEPLSTENKYQVRRNFLGESSVEVGSFNDFYFKGYFLGIISVLVFNRDMWLACVKPNNFLKHWLYYETVAKILIISNKKKLYIKQPVVITGQDCRWVENGTELFTFINSLILRERMIDFGFDKKKIMEDLASNSKRILVMLLRAKGHGLKCNFYNLKYIYRNLPKIGWYYLFLTTLIYFIPNVIIVIIRRAKFFLKQFLV